MMLPMSQKREHDIACPFCGQEQKVELWDSIDVDGEPELRNALLFNRVNNIECESCNKRFRVEKPLVYRDREQDIFIHYDPLIGTRTLTDVEATFQAAMEEMDRLLPKDVLVPSMGLVMEWGELVERIFLLEEGLDARLVEHIKYMLYQQNPDSLPAAQKNLLFNAQDSTEEQLNFVVQDRKTRKLEAALNFARADYEALLNVYDTDEQLALLEEQFPGPYLSGRLRDLQDRAESGE